MVHELVTCPSNDGHVFQFRLATCPWCSIEGRAGTTLFHAAQPRAGVAAFDLARAWAAIEAVASPGAAPALPDPVARPPARRSARARRRGLGCRALAALAGLATLAALASLATDYPVGLGV